MGQIVEFEGQKHDFPDDFSQDDIAKALKQVARASWAEAADPRQITRSVTNATAQVGLANLKTSILQRPEEGTLAPGFAENPGGAVTGRLQSGDIIRQERLRSQEEQQVPAQEEKAKKSSEALKEVTPKNPTTGQEIISSVMQSAAPLAAGLAVGAVNPLAGVAIATAGGAVLQGGSTYEEAKQKGATDLKASRAAGIDSLLESAGEATGLGYLFKSVFKIGGPFIKKLITGVAVEGGQELLTQVMQDAHAKVTYNPELTWEEAIHNAIVATGAGGLMGGGVAAGGHGVSKLKLEPGIVPLTGPSGEHTGETVDLRDLSGQMIPNQPPVRTKPLTSGTESNIQAIAKSIDPETISDEQHLQAKEAVKSFDASQKTPPLPESQARLAGFNDVAGSDQGAELGELRKSAKNAVNYPNVNDEIPRTERKILAGPEGSQGLTLEQVPIQASTYVIGEPTADRPLHLLEAMRETIEPWRAKYLPDSPIVLSNEGLGTSRASGWHSLTNGGIHLIVPGVLRSMKSPGTFNPKTQIKVFYNLAHEFGHALGLEKFFEGVSWPVASLVDMQSQKGLVEESVITQLPEPQQLVVREFNAIKQRILDGTMTAKEFQIEWMGPAKVTLKSLLADHSVAPDAPASQLVDKLVGRTANEISPEGVQKLRSEYLGFHEYFAEQVARYAYAKKWAESSALNKESLFAQAFASARAALTDFFKLLKREGGLAPGTKFQDWLDGLSQTKVVADTPGIRVVPGRVPKAPKAVKAKPKVQPVDHNEESDSLSAGDYKLLLAGLIESEDVKRGTPLHKELLSLLKARDYSTFVDRVQPLLEKHVQKELDTSGANEEMDDYFAGYPAEGQHAALPIDERQHMIEQADTLGSIIMETDDTYLSEQQKISLGDDLVLAIDLMKAPGSFQEGKDAYNKVHDKYTDLTTIVEPAKTTFEQVPFEPMPEGQWKAMTGVEPAKPRKILAKEPSNYKPTAAELVDAAREWRLFGFGSKYFKAWFGEWELAPHEASKVVTGMSGRPLILYHATRAHEGQVFDQFARGDVGFHFGTLRAAHNRAYGGGHEGAPPTLQEALDIMEMEEGPAMRSGTRFVQPKPIVVLPIVLNLRNPLYVGEEMSHMWGSPEALVNWLHKAGYISYSEWHAVETELETKKVFDPSLQEISDHARFEPVRRFLESKGYDGIRYENIVEGDTSYVAFRPEQVKSILGTKTFSKSPKIHLELDFDEATPDGENAATFLSKFGRFLKDIGPLRRALRAVTNLQYKTLQLQQLAQLNPDLEFLPFMNEKNLDYNLFKSALQAVPDRVIHQWGSPFLGKENFAKIGQFLQNEDSGQELWVTLQRNTQSNEWEYIPNELFYSKLKEHGIAVDTPEGETFSKLILDIKNSLLHQVNELEKVLVYLYGRRYSTAPQGVLQSAIAGVVKDIHDIRKRPFFPAGRFGNYVVTIEKKRDGARGYETVHREAFESEAEWRAAWQKAEAKVKGDERVRGMELTESEYTLMSIPQDFAELVVSELGLEGNQIETLQNILMPIKREKTLKAYDKERLGISGASADALRSYANFAWHNANAVAKLRYRAEFNHAIRDAGTALRAAQLAGPEQATNVARLTRVKAYMERTRDYIMAPPNEAHQVRSFVALSYLALNPKTALLNTLGLMTTYSHITSKFGLVQGNVIFAKAAWNALASIRLTDLTSVRKVKGLDERLQAGLDKATAEGVLSQSYAYHLANASNQNNLYRLPSQRLIGRGWQRGVDSAMWLFRLTELSTRRISFLSLLEGELIQPDAGMNSAYSNAVQDTNKLQNDYSAGNRVPFMRGKYQSMATVFMSFAQHAAFHAYGGYELGNRRKYAYDKAQGLNPKKPAWGYTMKLWIMLLALAGYEGLPGAENLLDLLDIIWKLFEKKPMRQSIRELVQDISFDPVYAAHGLGHNVFGFDISRSAGFGRLVPGTDTLNRTTTDLNRQVGTLVFDLAGPTGNMIEWMLKTAFDKKTFGESMKQFPGGIGNMVTAIDWSTHGVRNPYGGRLIRDLTTGELRDPTTAEILGRAAGFNPTAVSNEREIQWQQNDARTYWVTRRSRLFEDYWRATLNQDREAIADVRKAIQEFNKDIPEGVGSKVRITPSDLAKSRQVHMTKKRLSEQGKSPQGKRYNELFKGIRESFDEPASE